LYNINQLLKKIVKKLFYINNCLVNEQTLKNKFKVIHQLMLKFRIIMKANPLKDNTNIFYNLLSTSKDMNILVNQLIGNDTEIIDNDFDTQKALLNIYNDLKNFESNKDNINIVDAQNSINKNVQIVSNNTGIKNTIKLDKHTQAKFIKNNKEENSQMKFNNNNINNINKIYSSKARFDPNDPILIDFVQKISKNEYNIDQINNGKMEKVKNSPKWKKFS